MRYAFAAAAALLQLPAAPAPRISLVIGAGGIAGASLDEDGHWVSTMSANSRLILAQAWIDRQQVMADIVGPTWNYVAQLRVRFAPRTRRRPNSARGTLTLRGRTYRVRCEDD